MALIYVDRLIQRNNFLLTELNVHRVIITAILLAAKFFDDAYYNNAYYAKVGGVLVSEMNGLEVDFLFRINFSLHVTPELFDKYRAELVSHSLTANLISQPSHTKLELGTNPRMSSPLVQPTLVCAPPSQPTHSSSMNGVPLNGGCNTLLTRETALASQITPSPPHGISAMPPPPHVACVNENMLTSDHHYGMDQHYMGAASNVSSEFLLHVNTVPLDMQKLGSYTFPIMNGQGQSYSPLRPYSAPTIPMMQVNGCHAVPMATASRLPSSDQFVVVDGRMYHVQGSVAHYAGMEGAYGGVVQQQQQQQPHQGQASGYLQCPNLQRRHSDQSYIARDGMVTTATPHYIGGQMLTSMSGL